MAARSARPRRAVKSQSRFAARRRRGTLWRPPIAPTYPAFAASSAYTRHRLMSRLAAMLAAFSCRYTPSPPTRRSAYASAARWHGPRRSAELGPPTISSAQGCRILRAFISHSVQSHANRGSSRRLPTLPGPHGQETIQCRATRRHPPTKHRAPVARRALSPRRETTSRR